MSLYYIAFYFFFFLYLCAGHFSKEAKMPAKFLYPFSHQLLPSVKEVSTFCLLRVTIYLRSFPRASFLVFAERTEVREL